jgi:hypothetical protein
VCVQPTWGGEFQVNTYTTGSQSDPAVAAAADGAFVVVWESWGQEYDLDLQITVFSSTASTWNFGTQNPVPITSSRGLGVLVGLLALVMGWGLRRVVGGSGGAVGASGSAT